MKENESKWSKFFKNLSNKSNSEKESFSRMEDSFSKFGKSEDKSSGQQKGGNDNFWSSEKILRMKMMKELIQMLQRQSSAYERMGMNAEDAFESMERSFNNFNDNNREQKKQNDRLIDYVSKGLQLVGIRELGGKITDIAKDALMSMHDLAREEAIRKDTTYREELDKISNGFHDLADTIYWDASEYTKMYRRVAETGIKDVTGFLENTFTTSLDRMSKERQTYLQTHFKDRIKDGSLLTSTQDIMAMSLDQGVIDIGQVAGFSELVSGGLLTNKDLGNLLGMMSSNRGVEFVDMVEVKESLSALLDNVEVNASKVKDPIKRQDYVNKSLEDIVRGAVATEYAWGDASFISDAVKDIDQMDFTQLAQQVKYGVFNKSEGDVQMLKSLIQQGNYAKVYEILGGRYFNLAKNSTDPLSQQILSSMQLSSDGKAFVDSLSRANSDPKYKGDYSTVYNEGLSNIRKGDILSLYDNQNEEKVKHSFMEKVQSWMGKSDTMLWINKQIADLGLSYLEVMEVAFWAKVLFGGIISKMVSGIGLGLKTGLTNLLTATGLETILGGASLKAIVGGAAMKGLTLLPKALPIIGGVFGAIGAVMDGIKGLDFAKDWNVGGINAFISSALGGTKDGGWNSISGATKWGGVGALVGSIAGPVGTIIGGIIGAGLGGLAGWIGGEDISKFFSSLYDSAEENITLFAEDISEVYDETARWYHDKYKDVTSWFRRKYDNMVEFKDKTLTEVENWWDIAKDVGKSRFDSVVLSIYSAKDTISDKLGEFNDSVTEFFYTIKQGVTNWFDKLTDKMKDILRMIGIEVDGDSNTNQQYKSPRGGGSPITNRFGGYQNANSGYSPYKDGKINYGDPSLVGKTITDDYAISSMLKMGVKPSLNDLVNLKISGRKEIDVSSDELNTLIKNKLRKDSVFQGMGQYFIDASNKTGIPAIDLLAYMSHETGGGDPNNSHVQKNNFGGIGAFDSNPSNSFNMGRNVGEGIVGTAEWINKNYASKPNRDTWWKANNDYSTDKRNDGDGLSWSDKIVSSWIVGMYKDVLQMRGELKNTYSLIAGQDVLDQVKGGENLKDVDPKLGAIIAHAIKTGKITPNEIRIAEGLRSTERQNELYQQGRTVPGNIVTHLDGFHKISNHQKGKALDIYPTGVTNDSDPRWGRVTSALKESASELGIGISQGIDWKGSWDKPHLELTGEDYHTEKFNTYLGNDLNTKPVSDVSVPTPPIIDAPRRPYQPKESKVDDISRNMGSSNIEGILGELLKATKIQTSEILSLRRSGQKDDPFKTI